MSDLSVMHTIEHFRRLAPLARRDLAIKFDLIREEDGNEDRVGIWLLRAKETGKLDELGEAVQLAPQ